MTLSALLCACATAGISLWIEGDSIRYRGPAAAITPELTAGIRANKADLLYALNERAGIMEHDGGLDRATAELLAEIETLGPAHPDAATRTEAHK